MLVFRDDYYVLPGPILPVPPLREAVQFEGVASPGHGVCSAMRALWAGKIRELGREAELASWT
jgi:hypothetical protein